MAYSTIPKGNNYFNTLLYTGNATDNRAITGVGFKPDFTWIKDRNSTASNILQDVVRGADYQLQSNSSAGQTNDNNKVKSFDSDGFTIGTGTWINANNDPYVSWNWLAGGSQGSSNTDGSINTTYTSVNTTSGFSISQYTGTGSVATVGHGLGSVPKMIIIKNLSSNENWPIYHHKLGNTNSIYLDENFATFSASTFWNNTTPTSSVFTINSSGKLNDSGVPYIAYCFSEKIGYNNFGSYQGTATGDGAFVYTGFKPAFVMFKIYNDTNNWVIIDNKRDAFNGCSIRLFPNLVNAEAGSVGSETFVDFLSNGFKLKTNDQEVNGNDQYIYMAFAENPFVATSGTNAIPVTAR